MTTSINERTHFFRKIYLSHFILERVAKGLMLVVCERWVGDGDRLLHVDPKFFFDHSSTSFVFWLAAQPWVTEGPSALSGSCYHTGILAPTATARLTQAVCGTWLYNCLTSTWFLWAYASAPNSTTFTGQGDIPISSTGRTCFAFFCLFTLVHLLIDGSVEG